MIYYELHNVYMYTRTHIYVYIMHYVMKGEVARVDGALAFHIPTAK